MVRCLRTFVPDTEASTSRFQWAAAAAQSVRRVRHSRLSVRAQMPRLYLLAYPLAVPVKGRHPWRPWRPLNRVFITCLQIITYDRFKGRQGSLATFKVAKRPSFTNHSSATRLRPMVAKLFSCLPTLELTQTTLLLSSGLRERSTQRGIPPV